MSDRRDAAARRIRVALFALIGGAGLAIVLVVFGGLKLVHPRNLYSIDFVGTVYGLEKGGDVYYEGVRIGNVAAMQIAGPGRVHVVVALRRGIPLRADTQAFLLYAGITGVKEIDLRGGTPTAPPLPPGGTIPVGRSELDQLSDQVGQLVQHSTKLLDEATRAATNVANATAGNELGALVTQTRQTAASLAAASEALRAMIEENRTALRGSLDSVGTAAKGASDLVAELDRVVRSDQAEIHAALESLRQASRSFNDLVRELRSSPSRLLFSKPPPERKLP